MDQAGANPLNLNNDKMHLISVHDFIFKANNILQ